VRSSQLRSKRLCARVWKGKCVVLKKYFSVPGKDISVGGKSKRFQKTNEGGGREEKPLGPLGAAGQACRVKQKASEIGSTSPRREFA